MFNKINLLYCDRGYLEDKLNVVLNGELRNLYVLDSDLEVHVGYNSKEEAINDIKEVLKINGDVDEIIENLQSSTDRLDYSMKELSNLIGEFFGEKINSKEVLIDKYRGTLYFLPEN